MPSLQSEQSHPCCTDTSNQRWQLMMLPKLLVGNSGLNSGLPDPPS